jgi:anthranilate phosphoribosyltransferase
MSDGLLSGEAAGMSLGELVRAATLRPLTAAEAERAFGEVMGGNATPVQMAASAAPCRTKSPAASAR